MSTQMLKQKINQLGELPEGDTPEVLRKQLARLEQGEPEPVGRLDATPHAVVHYEDEDTPAEGRTDEETTTEDPGLAKEEA